MFQGRKRKFAKGRKRRQIGEMNKTEAAYAELLEARRLAGEIEAYEFEKQKFRLANNTWYTPDFIVQLADGLIQIHEVKAMTSKGKTLIEDDANVKMKVIAEQFNQYPFFLAAMRPKKLGGGFQIRELYPAREST